MKKVLLSSMMMIVILLSGNLKAQQKGPNISFDKEVHDFGTFKEEAGKQAFKFQFTNTGSEPLIVNRVKASCGCTATDYTKAPVPPGGKGFVTATYNPKNRPGKFNKSVTVTTNAKNKPVTVLRIQGTVTPKQKTLEDYYPTKWNDLRLKSHYMSLVKVYNNEVKTDTMGIVNTGTKDLKLTFENVPSHLSIKAIPEVLKPKQKGVIEVTYDGKKQKTWGFSTDRVYVHINGQRDNKHRLTVSAKLEEDFTHLTEEEKANAPKIEFKNRKFEFGTIKEGEKTSYDFEFTNTGKSDLKIRRIKASCGCTATKPEHDVIKPGQTSKIQTTFNSRGKRGNQRKTITVITNDPTNPQVILQIKGTVQKTAGK